MADIVVAGHLCLDIIPQLRGALPEPGRTVEAEAPVLATGGVVANTGLALHLLGVPVRLVGLIGADMFGAAVRAIIERYGAHLSDTLVCMPDVATSNTIILNPPGVDRMFIHTSGANASFSGSVVSDAALAGVRLLHYGYPTTMPRMVRDDGAEIAALFKRAKSRDITTSLDTAMPDPDGRNRGVNWRSMLANVLPHVDLFLPSVGEMLLMLDRARYDQFCANGDIIEQVTPALLRTIADEMLALGATIVMIKVGHRGIFLRTADASALAQLGRARPVNIDAWANRDMWSPAFAVNVVGTTGAGDATVAGFLMGLLRGMAPDEALTAACAVGACCVEAADATSGVRSWPETAARIADGWQRRASFELQ